MTKINKLKDQGSGIQALLFSLTLDEDISNFSEFLKDEYAVLMNDMGITVDQAPINVVLVPFALQELAYEGYKNMLANAWSDFQPNIEILPEENGFKILQNAKIVVFADGNIVKLQGSFEKYISELKKIFSNSNPPPVRLIGINKGAEYICPSAVLGDQLDDPYFKSSGLLVDFQFKANSTGTSQENQNIQIFILASGIKHIVCLPRVKRKSVIRIRDNKTGLAKMSIQPNNNMEDVVCYRKTQILEKARMGDEIFKLLAIPADEYSSVE